MAVELDSTEEHAVVVRKLKTAKTVCAKGSRTTRPPDDHTHHETKTIKSEKNSPRRRKDQVGDVADGRDRRFLPRSSSPTRTAALKRTETPGIRRRMGSGEDGNPLQGESSVEEERGDRGRFIRYDGRKREDTTLVKERGSRRFGRKEEQETPVAGSRNEKYDAEIRQRRSKNDHEVDAEERPKRRKRVIRIDPHDISNKRIVDSVPPGDIVVKKEAELSLNAQFRAIKPTPSILSFVEDNLLGRRRTHELKKAGFNIDLSAPLDNIPFSTRTDRERIEESVFRNSLEFFAAAKVSTSFPPPILPEIAFAGRSNVGKSSLLNALTRQWGVVRTSDKPGLTQTINFFRLASKLCLVDLPGYGFAYAKEEVKDAWEELVKEYVSTRESLQKVCVLIDTKWGMRPRDHELIELMERSKTPYQIVLTKTDLVFPMDVARRAMQIQEDLKTRKSIVEPVMMISSKSGAGIRSLRTVLAKFARFMKP